MFVGIFRFVYRLNYFGAMKMRVNNHATIHVFFYLLYRCILVHRICFIFEYEEILLLLFWFPMCCCCVAVGCKCNQSIRRAPVAVYIYVNSVCFIIAIYSAIPIVHNVRRNRFVVVYSAAKAVFGFARDRRTDGTWVWSANCASWKSTCVRRICTILSKTQQSPVVNKLFAH